MSELEFALDVMENVQYLELGDPRFDNVGQYLVVKGAWVVLSRAVQAGCQNQDLASAAVHSQGDDVPLRRRRTSCLSTVTPRAKASLAGRGENWGLQFY